MDDFSTDGEGDTGMRIVARIPDASAPADGSRAEALRSPPPLDRGRGTAETRPPRGRWRLAALAVVAVLAWVLASWSEHVRLHRQRGALRVARDTVAAPAASGSGPAAGGAVIR